MSVDSRGLACQSGPPSTKGVRRGSTSKSDRYAVEGALVEIERALCQDRSHVAIAATPGPKRKLLMRAVESRLESSLKLAHVFDLPQGEEEICARILASAEETIPNDPEQGLLHLVSELASLRSALVVVVENASALPSETVRYLGRLAAVSRSGLRLVFVADLVDPSGADPIAGLVSTLGFGVEKVVLESGEPPPTPAFPRLAVALDRGKQQHPLRSLALGTPRPSLRPARMHWAQRAALGVLGLALVLLIITLTAPSDTPEPEPAQAARAAATSDPLPGATASLPNEGAAAPDGEPSAPAPPETAQVETPPARPAAAEPVPAAAQVAPAAVEPPRVEVVAAAESAIAPNPVETTSPLEPAPSPLAPTTRPLEPATSPLAPATSPVAAPEPPPVAVGLPETPDVTPAPVVPALRVNVNAAPWARVEVDGREVGVTPIGDLPLSEGEHRFRAHFPDGRVVERDIHIDPFSRHIRFP